MKKPPLPLKYEIVIMAVFVLMLVVNVKCAT